MVVAGATILVGAIVVAQGRPSNHAAAVQSSNAAYRDGVFQAQLAIDRHSTEQPSVSRWSRPADREMFVAGYKQRINGSNS
jgi:hypothetical protein